MLGEYVCLILCDLAHSILNIDAVRVTTVQAEYYLSAFVGDEQLAFRPSLWSHTNLPIFKLETEVQKSFTKGAR